MRGTAVQQTSLRDFFYQCLLDLSHEEGINASGKDEIYGCIFGRDSAITILKILKVHNQTPMYPLLETSRRALLTLVSLQGKELNLESGEEPGKFIHEFRKDKFDHLVNREIPWYIYPDGALRNYDSIDSTPLTLIALYKYFEVTNDKEFLMQVLPSVERGLNWIITYGDKDKDLLIEYEFPVTRKHGGLLVQSWTDSHESLRGKNGEMPYYPIAPVEAQSYAWLALSLWGNFYKTYAPTFSKKLLSQAENMKKCFREAFVFETDGLSFLAQALDGNKKQIKTITGNPLLCLWAASETGSHKEAIIDKDIRDQMVQRAFKNDMFDADGGIRTMSTKSQTFNPNQDSYHNGSFWPILNGLAHEGLVNFGYTKEANTLREASLKPLTYFGTPIELYIKTETGTFVEYKNPDGQVSCKYQAWSAAAALDWYS
jgi:glycogen debranching enzyme